jgi:glycosyltransferase involved in cell wall biosynthesis
MKKVLIVAYFPPHPQASPRILGLAKYLPEFGWQPIILTAPVGDNLDSQFGVIETGYRDVLGVWKRLFNFNQDEDLRREVKKRLGVTSKKSALDFILTLGGAIVNYPDGDKGWKPFAVDAGSELLQKENIDAMISSSSPVTSHIIAKELKIKHKIPWVADLRDLWTQNHNYGYGPLRRLIDRRLEKKTLLHSDALVTVSQLWAEKLRTLHRRETVYTITNGFDPVEMNTTRVNLTSKFTITYTGSIYSEKQEPSKLFAALKDLISDRLMDPNEVAVRFYGSKIEWLDKEVERYGLSSIVKQYGRVPQQVALEKQRESQLLLLLNWEDQQEHGVYPGKVFEYLAAQRPILATGGFGNDVIERLLHETKAGRYGSTVEDIKNILSELYLEYKLTGKITYNGNIEKINKYSHREMARKFAGVLDQVTSK